MKKIAAVAVAGVLAAGTTAVVAAQSAEAYAIKPTLCQILGADTNAKVYYRLWKGDYPAQYFVKAPGAVPTGSVHVYYHGAANTQFSLPLTNGTVIKRVPANAGKLTIKIGYSGSAGFAACNATFTTTLK